MQDQLDLLRGWKLNSVKRAINHACWCDGALKKTGYQGSVERPQLTLGVHCPTSVRGKEHFPYSVGEKTEKFCIWSFSRTLSYACLPLADLNLYPSSVLSCNSGSVIASHWGLGRLSWLLKMESVVLGNPRTWSWSQKWGWSCVIPSHNVAITFHTFL